MQLEYEQQISTYEEWYGIRVYYDHENDQYYIQRGGINPFMEDQSKLDDWDEIEISSLEEVLDEIDHWEQMINEE